MICNSYKLCLIEFALFGLPFLINFKSVKFYKKKYFFSKKNFINSNLKVAKRILFVGFINTLIGPSILLILNNFTRDLVKSYLFMEIFMFFFKTLMYRKFVFNEIKSKKSYIVPLVLVLWGFLLSNLINGLYILQTYKAISLVTLLTLSNPIIALIGSRFLKKNSKCL